MRSDLLGWLVVSVALWLPVTLYAQEATLSGAVTDSTGGVLPGVTVTAVHEATGNTFVAVTDETGKFRIPARIGEYRLTAELAGFATVNRSGLQLLVGQLAVVNLQMSPSTVQESVTVTGEAPLIETSQSSLGSNIDPKQLSELPVNGRNFLDLAMLAAGNRSNSLEAGGGPGGGEGTFQINIDGQQVTNNCCGTNHQASFSRDAIAEFQFIANRFDAVQGRSTGVQVNVVTKSGTNSPSGNFSGYFRSDKFNAADFVAKDANGKPRVLPYSDQQVSATFGGPIVKDKVHYFASYEFEREPATITHNSQWPSFNIDLPDNRKQHKAAARGDIQFSSQTRLSLTGSMWQDLEPIARTLTGGAARHPSASVSSDQYSENLQASLTKVLGNRALNETKFGWSGTSWAFEPNITWGSKTGLGAARNPVSNYAPNIALRSYTIGPASNYPQYIGQDIYSLRDDFTYSFNQGGHHDLRTGGEYLDYLTWHNWCNFLNGSLDVQGGAVPANIEALFPVWNDPSTWNIAALNPIARRYRASLGNCNIHSPRKIVGAWTQDDWAVTSRLTLNLGIRYDLETDIYANELAVPPFLKAGRPDDTNNVAPRLGFAFSLNDRTVIRAGYGKFFAEVNNQAAHGIRFAVAQRVPEVLSDRRSDFAVNPWNGPLPAFDKIEQLFCNVNFVTGCVRRAIGQSMSPPPPDAQYPYSNQTSIGVARQIGGTMAFGADYVWTGQRHSRSTGFNINLAYNPATGANYPITDLTKLPYPDWGIVIFDKYVDKSDNHALVASLTKRYSSRWQASATYTLQYDYGYQPPPVSPGCQYPTTLAPTGPVCNVPFQLAPDLIEETYLTGAQRNRAVFNGIWDVGYGFQLSGLYFFADNGRSTPTSGVDVRNTSGSGTRLRPDFTLIPRNSFKRDPLHRVDLRVQRRFRIAGNKGVDGILEVFNLFNHANYAGYTTNESSGSYGKPTASLNVAYQPRMMQLGFRVAF